MVPLAQVATIRPSPAPDQINRLDLERVATIEGNYEGRALTEVVRDVQTRASSP
jgi:HAE1 family hydrophobic/amphiphilic exporter-1